MMHMSCTYRINSRDDEVTQIWYLNYSDRQQQLVDLRKSLIDPNSPPAAGMVNEIAQAVATSKHKLEIFPKVRLQFGLCLRCSALLLLELALLV